MRPRRGEVWYVDFSPVRGHEQDGVRPAVVMSTRRWLPAPLALVVPLTTRFRGVPSHVPIHPPEGGLRSISYGLCEQTRAVDTVRFKRRMGRVSDPVLTEISYVLHLLMALQCPPSDDEILDQLQSIEPTQ